MFKTLEGTSVEARIVQAVEMIYEKACKLEDYVEHLRVLEKEDSTDVLELLDRLLCVQNTLEKLEKYVHMIDDLKFNSMKYVELKDKVSLMNERLMQIDLITIHK